MKSRKQFEKQISKIIGQVNIQSFTHYSGQIDINLKDTGLFISDSQFKFLTALGRGFTISTYGTGGISILLYIEEGVK